MKAKKVFIEIMRIILLIILFPVVVAYILFKFVHQVKTKKENMGKIKIMSASQIDELSGKEFEILLKDLFEKMGYTVKMTKTSHDYGADLIVSKGKHASLVQAKRYDHSVGIRAIQEIIGAKRHYGVQNAIVITNQNFTKDAEILSLENEVNLIDRNALLELIAKFDVHVTRLKFRFVATTKEVVAQIEKKYPNWI